VSATADIRVCFVGDSLTVGTRDPDHLGWVGRVSAQATAGGFELTTYNLGVRRETSTDIAARWADECARRLPQSCRPHVVFSFGVNDTTEESGQTRVASQDSLKNLRDILSTATARYAVAMIGPPPVDDTDQNSRIQALCQQFGIICRELRVPYLAVFESLRTNPIWMQQVAENDGAHPRAEGYAALAQLVIEWKSWWFRSSSI
jgi:acyl-CoA thioesterase-1